MIDSALADLVRVVIREELAAMPFKQINRDEQPKPILTRTEAMRYVRRSSKGAFYAWLARWYGPRGAQNRYSKTRLDLALAREAGEARTPAGMRK
jgi:hypothetical protein